MTIYKRAGKSGFWWTRFTFDGVEVRQSTKTANRQAALGYEAALRLQLSLGKIGFEQLGRKKPKPLHFSGAIADYIENIEVKESTRRRYEVASKALIEFFGNSVVTAISISEVERFRAWRKRQNKKAPAKRLVKTPTARLNKTIRPATVNRELTLLSGLFRWLGRIGKASENPVKEVAFLREENDQTRVVSDPEFRSYIVAAGQPLRDVAMLMFETGMRPGEIFNLRKDDIDFTNGKIIIRSGKTEAAKRRLTMSDTVTNILSERYGKTKGELLFPGGKKGDKEIPILKLTNAHKAAIGRIKGLRPFRLYDLRHTFATHLTQSGVDLMTVKAILGHSRLEMVQRYSHPTEQHQADAIQKLEAFRKRPDILGLAKTA